MRSCMFVIVYSFALLTLSLSVQAMSNASDRFETLPIYSETPSTISQNITHLQSTNKMIKMGHQIGFEYFETFEECHTLSSGHCDRQTIQLALKNIAYLVIQKESEQLVKKTHRAKIIASQLKPQNNPTSSTENSTTSYPKLSWHFRKDA